MSSMDFDNKSTVPDCACVQCDWKGTIDEAEYSDDGMACPICGETAEILEDALNNDRTGETIAPKGSWPF